MSQRWRNKWHNITVREYRGNRHPKCANNMKNKQIYNLIFISETFELIFDRKLRGDLEMLLKQSSIFFLLYNGMRNIHYYDSRLFKQYTVIRQSIRFEQLIHSCVRVFASPPHDSHTLTAWLSVLSTRQASADDRSKM